MVEPFARAFLACVPPVAAAATAPLRFQFQLNDAAPSTGLDDVARA